MTTQTNNHPAFAAEPIINTGYSRNFPLTADVKRVKLDDYGFEEAGVNKGNPEALSNHLSEIKEGHLIDASHVEDEENRKKSQIESSILEKQHDLQTVATEMQRIEEELIPGKEREIGELRDEIRTTKTNQAEQRQHPSHDPLMLWVYGVISVLLGLYLVLFYASAIHAAFFRNLLGELFEGGNTDNIGETLNSIFDPKAIFTLSPSMLFIYLGSFLFISIGLLAHQYLNKPATVLWKRLLVAIPVMLIPLGADYLLAYKIHTTIREAKSLMGIEDLTPWYSSTTFWLVIVFGYVAYMAWAGIFQLFRSEKNKRNPQYMVAFLIRNLIDDIHRLQEEIRQYRDTLHSLRNKKDQLNHELEELRHKLGRIMQDPSLLLQNLHQFYKGWLRYLNAGNKERVVSDCDIVFKQFLTTHFSQSEEKEPIQQPKNQSP